MKYITYYDPNSKIKQPKSSKIITIFFIVVLSLAFLSIPITYYIFGDFVVPTLIGICILTLLFLMFIYNLNAKDDWYKTTAFSFTNGEGLYIYDLNNIRFLSVFNMLGMQVHKSFSRFLIVHIVNKLEEQKQLKRLLNTIKSNNAVEYIIRNNLEKKAGISIRRIINIYRHKSYTTLIYTYMTEKNKPERKMTVNVYNNINEYEGWISLFEKYMKKNRYICDRCGSIMGDAPCPNCLGTVVRKDKGISKKNAKVILLVLSIILVGTIAVFVGVLLGYISVVVMPVCLIVFITLITSIYTLYDNRLTFI